MSRCEDYPCCGHGPPPLGDGGGCPTPAGLKDVGPCPDCRSGLYDPPEPDVDDQTCQTCGGTGRDLVEVLLWPCVECGRRFEPTSSSICPPCLRHLQATNFGEDEDRYDDDYDCQAGLDV